MTLSRVRVHIVILIFHIFICVTNDGPYTFIKRKVFTFIFPVFPLNLYAISINNTRLRRGKSISIPNFYEISQTTAEIKLIPVSENGRSPYWKSNSGFTFDRRVILHLPVKFRSNRTIGGEVMTLYRFLRWWPHSRKSTSGFRFSDCTRLKKWKSICVQNFDEISQSAAEIKLIPVSEADSHRIGILLPV